MNPISLTTEEVRKLIKNHEVQISRPTTHHPGETLWVREEHHASLTGNLPTIDYHATVETDDPCAHPITIEQFEEIETKPGEKPHWRKPDSMPQWASRLTVQITNTPHTNNQPIKLTIHPLPPTTPPGP